jgi:hypothetical protein
MFASQPTLLLESSLRAAFPGLVRHDDQEDKSEHDARYTSIFR